MKHTYEPHGDNNWTLVTIMMFSCSLIFVRRYRGDAGDRAKLSVHCNNLSFRRKGMFKKIVTMAHGHWTMCY